MIRIALDAMGSDAWPTPDVAGAVQALRADAQLKVLLFGDESRLKAEVDKQGGAGLALEIIHAPEHIRMGDQAAQSSRAKPDSSIHRASEAVAKGEADAFVSAGNTGAILSILTLHTLHRIRGVKRPTLSAILPLPQVKRRVVLADIGANTDCKPDWLLQFALMGALYAQHALGVAQPKVGLLANGEEEGKGTDLLRETAQLLRHSPLHFYGYVEPKEVLRGQVDVMVTDGFTGNIFIKTMEAFGSELVKLIRAELTAQPLSTLGGLLARPAFRRVRKHLDPFEIGGAPLLGVNGVALIAHGRTNALGIANALHQARRAYQGGVIHAIQEGLAQLGES
jgi:glycerol-3-phosphate acyltransferase PlsX